MLNKQKKYLGQHFLKNKKILEEMARAAEITKRDVVLEIGPGTGTLTEVLAKYAKRVIAIEKDHDLIPILQEKFKDSKNVKIIESDILKVKITHPHLPSLKVREGEGSYKLRFPKKYKIVANIPYYITSRFLRVFLEAKKKPELMVLMIQKEVADRIMAKNKNESLLSLSVKAYGKPEIIRYVSKKYFSPPPKVDSAIIKISGISDKFFKENKIDEKYFFEILRTAFQKKRKMLRRSLGKKINLPEKYQNMRPEDLELTDWLEIFKSKN